MDNQKKLEPSLHHSIISRMWAKIQEMGGTSTGKGNPPLISFSSSAGKARPTCRQLPQITALEVGQACCRNS
ncbi:hypothetical protein GN956_G16171 [Arapaima gigas]